ESSVTLWHSPNALAGGTACGKGRGKKSGRADKSTWCAQQFRQKRHPQPSRKRQQIRIPTHSANRSKMWKKPLQKTVRTPPYTTLEWRCSPEKWGRKTKTASCERSRPVTLTSLSPPPSSRLA